MVNFLQPLLQTLKVQKSRTLGIEPSPEILDPLVLLVLRLSQVRLQASYKRCYPHCASGIRRRRSAGRKLGFGRERMGLKSSAVV